MVLMMNRGYFQYAKLISKRRSKDTLLLMYKRFLGIFLESDREKIMYFLLVSSKVLVVVPILFFLLFYTLAGSVYSSQVVAGVVFSGIVSIIHSLFSIHSKYGEALILEMKKELEFILRLLPKGMDGFFTIRKISMELLTSTLIFSIFPYGLSIILLFIFVNQSILVLVSGVIFMLLNYILAFALLMAKMTKIYVQSVKWFLIVFTTVSLAILVNTIDQKRLFPFHITNLFDYFLNNSQPVIGINIYLLWGIALIALTISWYFIYALFKKKKVVSALILTKEDGLHRIFKKKVVYQRLILRVFHAKNKLLYIKIGSILASVLIVLCYPVFSQNENIPLIIIILFFCYSPSIFNLLITHFLYDEILQKNFTNTTYYLLRKFQCKKYLYKQTIMATISQLFIMLLPFITLVLIYRSISPVLAIVSYFLVFMIIVTILVTRIYGLGKFTIEEVKMVEPAILTSKSTENFILFGIPIIYAIPMVSLTIAQSNLMYAYISTISYVALLLVYCFGKIYFSLAREGKDVTNM